LLALSRCMLVVETIAVTGKQIEKSFPISAHSKIRKV
jgi:hypothetical protein